MYSLIGFSNAVIAEALVLKITKNRIRVVVAGLDDAIQLRRVGQQWFSETGEPVTFEFLAADTPECTASPSHPKASRAAS